MLSAGLQQILFGSTFYPGATVALDFVAGKYRAPGINNYSADFASIPSLTVTRATPAVSYAPTASGLLVPFVANVARITDQGLLSEETRTNVVLRNRDLTNAVWTKTNATAALDQTGADGTANAASSLTATGANGTALQAITLASSARFQTAYVKRISGSGVVNMTMDNGVTWTAIILTTDWARVSIPTQTLANPTVGFRIVTSGDKIAVDFVDNENGATATSPIPTTSGAVTRAGDMAGISGLAIPLASTILVSATPLQSATSGIVAQLDDGTANNRVGMQLLSGNQPRYFQVRGGSSEASGQGTVVTVGQNTTFALRMAANDFNAAQGGTLFGADTTVTTPTMTNLAIGDRTDTVNEQPNAFIRKVVLYPSALSDGQLVAITS